MFTRNIDAAFDYAAICHAGQVRKGTQIPYLSHLMAVASLVTEAAADGEGEIPEDFEDLVIAGLLHKMNLPPDSSRSRRARNAAVLARFQSSTDFHRRRWRTQRARARRSWAVASS